MSAKLESIQTAIAEKMDAKALGEVRAGTNALALMIPASMGEAMEFAKLMAVTTAVPPHLRGKPGDCLAVAMQAWRWEADPFAVASKTYFVNDRIAYEAQLVNAIVYAKAPLEGRLQVDWKGDGEKMVCTVTGRFKNDPNVHTITQDVATITTKNSPLWKQAPRQQLAYFTTRLWARLFCPEVLMGIYTPDELVDVGTVIEGRDGTYAPPRPSRTDAPIPTEPKARGFEILTADGEHATFDEPQPFAGAFIEALEGAKPKGFTAVEEVWVVHSPQLGDLRALGDEGKKLAQQIHDVHDNILKGFDENGAPKA